MIVLDAALAVLEPEAVAVRLEDVNVVSETIEQPTGKQDPGPIHLSAHAGPIKLEPNPTKVLFRKRHNLFMLEMASVRL